MTGTDLEPRDDLTPTLFGTTNPAEALERMVDVAKTLTEVVRAQNLMVKIGQSEHLRVEAWTMLGSILGVFPVVEWTRPLLIDDVPVGWEARVEARTRAGEVVGAAEAECLRTERTWANRDDYALRSMAQTRAVSKALRGPLGFVVVLAGFNPTPSEEMPDVRGNQSAADRPATAKPVASVSPVPQAADGGEPASPDDSIPAVVELPETPFTEAGEKVVIDFPSDAMKKKLDVLVGKLRTAKHDPTPWIYETHARAVAGIPGEEMGHWAPLRERLTRREASLLIDKLEKYVGALK